MISFSNVASRIGSGLFTAPSKKVSKGPVAPIAPIAFPVFGGVNHIAAPAHGTPRTPIAPIRISPVRYTTTV
jgi:hypothetical protein